MADDLDDLSKQKIKRATGAMGQLAQGISQVFANTSPGQDDSVTILNELHRRGLPAWIGIDLLGWTMGSLNFAIGVLFDAGCDKAKAIKAIHHVCAYMITGAVDANDDPEEDFISDLDLHCDCDRYECPRLPERLGQAHHALTVSISSAFQLFNPPMITPLDRTGLADDSPTVIAYESTKKTLEEQHILSTTSKIESILEVLTQILIDSGMVRLTSSH